jgi:ubiquinone/menaquinone biosynthesis C-methylase UbiE
VFLTRFANCPRAEFRVGSFTQTSLPANSVNAIVSIDCFWMVLDKVAALKEMARILSIPGRLVMTTWTQPHVDVSALMVDAGFQVSLFEETELWRERQLRVYADIRANAKALRAEIGDKAADVLLFEATTAPDSLQKNARILVCAEKG